MVELNSSTIFSTNCSESSYWKIYSDDGSGIESLYKEIEEKNLGPINENWFINSSQSDNCLYKYECISCIEINLAENSNTSVKNIISEKNDSNAFEIQFYDIEKNCVSPKTDSFLINNNCLTKTTNEDFRNEIKTANTEENEIYKESVNNLKQNFDCSLVNLSIENFPKQFGNNSFDSSPATLKCIYNSLKTPVQKNDSKIFHLKNISPNVSNQHFIWSPITQEEKQKHDIVLPVFQTPLTHPFKTSTPLHIFESLGIQSCGKDLSWNSAMETPITVKDRNSSPNISRSLHSKSLIIPKTLFSPQNQKLNETEDLTDEHYTDICFEDKSIQKTNDSNIMYIQTECLNEEKNENIMTLISSPILKDRLIINTVDTNLNKNIVTILQNFVSSQKFVSNKEIANERYLSNCKSDQSKINTQNIKNLDSVSNVNNDFCIKSSQDKTSEMHTFCDNTCIHKTLSFLFASQLSMPDSCSKKEAFNHQENIVMSYVYSQERNADNLTKEKTSSYLEKYSFLSVAKNKSEGPKNNLLNVTLNSLMNEGNLTENKNLSQKMNNLNYEDIKNLSSISQEKNYIELKNNQMNSHKSFISNENILLPKYNCSSVKMIEAKTYISAINNCLQENFNDQNIKFESQLKDTSILPHTASFHSANGKPIIVNNSSLQHAKIMWDKVKDDPWLCISNQYNNLLNTNNSLIELLDNSFHPDDYNNNSKLKNIQKFSREPLNNITNILESSEKFKVSKFNTLNSQLNKKEILLEKLSSINNSEFKSDVKSDKSFKTADLYNKYYEFRSDVDFDAEDQCNKIPKIIDRETESQIHHFPDFPLTQVMEIAETTYACLKEMENGFSQIEFSPKYIKSNNDVKTNSLQCKKNILKETLLECMDNSAKEFNEITVQTENSNQVKSLYIPTNNDLLISNGSTLIEEIKYKTEPFKRNNNLDHLASLKSEQLKNIKEEICANYKDEEFDFEMVNADYFKGFTTASGKKIQVTEEALNKSKQIFDELNKCEMPISNRENFFKKQVKNNNFVDINHNLKITRNMISNDDKVSLDKFSQKNENISINNNKVNNNTELYEELSFCKENIKWENKDCPENKFLKTVQNEENYSKRTNDKSLDNHSKEVSILSEGNNSISFSTASGKQIIVSENALKTAKKLIFSEEEKLLIKDTENKKANQNNEENCIIEDLIEEMNYLPTFDMSYFTSCSQQDNIHENLQDDEKLFISNEIKEQQNILETEKNNKVLNSENFPLDIELDSNILDKVNKNSNLENFYLTQDSQDYCEIQKNSVESQNFIKNNEIYMEEALLKIKESNNQNKSKLIIPTDDKFMFNNKAIQLNNYDIGCPLDSFVDFKIMDQKDSIVNELKEEKSNLTNEETFENCKTNKILLTEKIHNCVSEEISTSVLNNSIKKPNIKSLFNNISKENVAFESELNSKQKFLSTNKLQEEILSFHGFSTASGKNISILPESISKAKIICNDIFCTNLIEKDKDIINNNPDLSIFNETSNENANIIFPQKNISNIMIQNNNNNEKNLLLLEKNSSKNIYKQLEPIEKNEKYEIFKSQEIIEQIENKTIFTTGEKKVNKLESFIENDKMINNDFIETESDLQISNKLLPNMSKFPSFSTANGKKIIISEKALIKAKEILDKDSFHSDNATEPILSIVQENKCKASKLPEICAETEKNVISVTSESCIETNKISYNDLIQTDTDLQICKELSLNTSKFSGFRTANGKKVIISEKALNKAKEMLDKVSCPVDGFTEPMLSIKEENKCKASKLSEISAETEKNIISVTSESCIENNKMQYNNLIQIVSDLQINKNFSLNTSEFPGFSTANGKKVIISEKALIKAKEILDNDAFPIDNSTESISLIKVPSMKENKCKVSKFQEMHTAKENNIISCTSKNCIENNKMLYSNLIPTESDLQIKKQISPNISKFPGFNTASGKQVTISEKALTKAKEILDKVSCPVDGFTEPMLSIKEENKCKSSKLPEISVETEKNVISVTSESCIENNKMFCNDLIQTNSNLQISKELSLNTSKFPGFSTANGKKVIISEKALTKAKEILDKDSFLSNYNSIEPILSIKEVPLLKEENQFKASKLLENCTATGKNVISENSLQATEIACENTEIKVNNLDNKVNAKTNFILTEKLNPNFNQIGFKNASGKNILVSEDALKKAKLLFQQSHVENISDNCSPESNEHFYYSQDKNYKLKNNCNLLHKNKQVLSKHSVLKNFGNQISADNSIDEIDSNLYSKRVTFVKRNFKEAELEDEDNVHIEKNHSDDKNNLIKTAIEEMHLLNSINNNKKCKTEDIKLKVNNDKDITGVNNMEKFNFSKTFCNMTIEMNINEKKYIAIKNQEERIKNKFSKKIDILPGKLWKMKNNSNPRQSLREFVNDFLPGTMITKKIYETNIQKSVVSLIPSKAKDFIFKAEEYFDIDLYTKSIEIKIADDMIIILNRNNEIGIEEICRTFLDGPGVDPNLINNDWIINHYEWIVWKLSAMEKAFPCIFGRKCLTPENVLLQLKYRYDKEIDHSQRSALRKIMERDDTPVKTMILFIADINKTNLSTENNELEDTNTENKIYNVKLSDGWYKIPTCVDSRFQVLIQKGKISVGQKLIISNSELIGSDSAYSPLEAPPELMLKINTNSVRRARWDAKLGYFKSPKPFPVSFSSLFPDGGLISCVDCLIQRVYPLLYMEKQQNGSLVFHNEKMETKSADNHLKLRNLQLEKLAASVQQEFEILLQEREIKEMKKNRKTCLRNFSKLENLNTGEEIYEVLKLSSQSGISEADLDFHQRNLLLEYKDKQQNKNQLEFQEMMSSKINEALEENKLIPERISIPLLKVLLVGISKEDIQKKSAPCMLTIWSPSEKAIQMLSEGKLLRIYNLIPGSKRNWKMQIQLNSTKSTDYEEIKNSSDLIELCYIPRMVSKFSETYGVSAYQQLDVVGIVVLITSNEYGLQQILYLCDEDVSFLAVIFPKGVAALGLEDMLFPGQFISISNLSNSSKNNHHMPTAIATELSLFSTCPKNLLLQEAMNHLRMSIKDVNNFVKQAQKHLENFQFHHLPQRNITPNVKFQQDISSLTNIRKSNSSIKRKLYPVYSPICLKSPIYSPLLKRHKSNSDSFITEMEIKTSPLDLKSSDTEARISILSKYGSAPPLPVLTSPASAEARKPFQPPIKQDSTPLGSKCRGTRQWRGKILPDYPINKNQNNAEKS